MATEWNINSDIYDIMENIKSLQKRYIEDEEETTLSLGVFGFLADTEAKKIQIATILTGQLGNEMFPSRAILTKNVLAHAIACGISDINAVPAQIRLTMCIKIADIVAHLKDDEDFFLDADCPIFIGDYEFHFDYDIKIRRIKVGTDAYSYSAQYVLSDENDQRIINRLSDIVNPYLNQPFIININNEEYVGIQCLVRQYTLEETTDTMVSDSIIENKSYTFEYSNQLADFRVVVTDNNEETEITPYLYGSTIDPEVENYCWYLFTADNTVRITFDSKSYIPGLNSQIYIKAYTTLGADGNFEYINVDQSSEGLYIDIESAKYGYTAITTYVVAESDSVNGENRKSKDELRKLIPKAALSRGSITTETDLNNYFNLINTETNRLVLSKKSDNQLNRIWYAYFVLKDDFNNIIPSNTISLQVDLDDTAHVTLSDDGRFIVPAGSYIRYDPVLKVGELIDEAIIPAEYTQSYFDSGYYYYITVYNMVISVEPLYAAYYLTITDHDSYFIYDYVNEACDVQFVANRYHFERKLITDQSDYNFTFSIVQSVLLESENPLIYTTTITTTNDEGEDEEQEIVTENVKVVLVIYKEEKPYRWKECTYEALNSDPATGIYNFSCRISTDDTMDDKNNIKIIGCNEAGSTNPVYGYVEEDCKAAIYVLANVPIDPSVEYPRKDLDNFAPGYTDYVVTNIYNCYAGLDFFENYTDITNTTVVKEENICVINEVPCIGRHYLRGNDEVSYLIEAIKERKSYIDYCLTLIENSMNIDFKFFNTYGDSRTYKLEDKETPIGDIDISLRFKLSLKDSTDLSTKDSVIKSIKSYIENLNDIGDLHIPNLIRDIINEYEDRIYYIEYVGFNNFGTDDQHIICVNDGSTDVPEFINVKNIIDPMTDQLVPDIDITIV